MKRIILIVWLSGIVFASTGCADSKIAENKITSTEAPSSIETNYRSVMETNTSAKDKLILADIRKEVDTRWKKTVNLIKNNQDYLDFLVQEIYSSESKIRVTYIKSQFEYLVDNKAEEPDEKSKETLISIFNKLDCDMIYTRHGDDPEEKILVVVLNDVKLDEENVYTRTLTYSEVEDHYGDLGEEILPNWYYHELFYT